MTFEEWYKDNPPPRMNTTEEFNSYIKQTWNAAIKAVIYDLGDQAYKDNYAYKSGDPEYAEDVAKKLLTTS